jgi:hypothetical protein
MRVGEGRRSHSERRARSPDRECDSTDFRRSRGHTLDTPEHFRRAHRRASRSASNGARPGELKALGSELQWCHSVSRALTELRRGPE